jgi:hypothetical protein
MKKSANLTLFVEEEPDVYLIDTSAWLNIEERSDRDDVWRIIFDLVEQGRVVVCAPVIAELKTNPIYLAKLKPYERALTRAMSEATIPNTFSMWEE